MDLIGPRLIEIEILSPADRASFSGGQPYEHRRTGSHDRQREGALLDLAAERCLVLAESYVIYETHEPDSTSGMARPCSGISGAPGEGAVATIADLSY